MARKILVVDDEAILVETIAYNQRGETILSFKRRVMVPTREHDEARQRAWEELPGGLPVQPAPHTRGTAALK